jgi:Tfp pilus assembly protein PilF
LALRQSGAGTDESSKAAGIYDLCLPAGRPRIVNSSAEAGAVPRRYKAFISYSWADKQWGGWVHRTLELYRTPAALVGAAGALGPIPRRLHPIFKDREEEAAGHGIGASIEAAMAASEFLIVICSPRSAKSQWVNREVAWFKTHQSKERILALVVDGEPAASLSPDKVSEECFPATLLYRVDANLEPTDQREDVPLAADARKSADGKRLAKLKLAAALLGVGLDDLVKRDDRRKAVRRRWAMGGMGAVAASMSALALIAVEQRDHARNMQAQAEQQRTQAESLVEFMIGDLRHKLQQEVQLKVLADIATRAQDYYAVQQAIAMDDDALGRRARVLDLLGDIEADLGNSDSAIDLIRQSIASSAELLRRAPDDPARIINHAHAVQGLGAMAYQTGDLALAASQMQQAVALTTRLVSLDETNLEWRAERASTLANAGIIHLRNNDVDAAAEKLSLAATIKRGALADAHNLRQAQYDLALTLSWLAAAMARDGRDEVALSTFEEEGRIYSAMLDANPDDKPARRRRAINWAKKSTLARHTGDTETAYKLSTQAVDEAEALLADDSADTRYLEAAINAQLSLGSAAVEAEQLPIASNAAARAHELLNTLLSINPDRAYWSGVLRGAVRNLLVLTDATGAVDDAACLDALAVIIAEAERLAALSADAPGDLELAQTAAFALMLAGDHAAVSGDDARADRAWAHGRALIAAAQEDGSQARDAASIALMTQLTERQKARAGVRPATACGGRRVSTSKAPAVPAAGEAR